MTTIEFSKEAKAAVDQAQQHAQQKRHSKLDGPHLFLAILRCTDVGHDWLHESHIDKNLLSNLESTFDEWYRNDANEVELSPTYIRIMRAAQNEVSQQGLHQISVEHLLKVVLETDEMLKEWLRGQGVPVISPVASTPTPLLDQLGRDLTRLAKRNSLPKVIGREDEVRQLIEVLLRHGKNSVVLLGEAGVGKTAVVERLAQDIADRNVPSKLVKVRLIELNVSNLVAGTSYRGQLEERLQQLLHEIEQTNDVIIVIDEFHTLMSAGTTRESGLDAANVLKPALARGELTCIGITTQNEYARFVEKDQAFARRFEKITVLEPSEHETRAILDGIAVRYEKHHGVTVEPSALDTIVKLAAQYFPARQFPDKAIDVLGRACSRAEMQEAHTVNQVLITAIVSELSGLPIGQLTPAAQDMLSNLEEHLAQSVVGQDGAVKVLAKAVRLSYAGLRDPKRPKGVFLFVGPSGVGKTQLAKSLAELLFGDEKALIRLDMSEYAEKHTVSRLIGAPPGYVGYDEPGQLTEPLRNRPYSVVLLDEIEKAHYEIFDIFLQLFDEGRLTDSHGRLIDGRHAMFIMTSNLGTAQVNKRMLGFDANSEKAADSAMEEALRSFFRPEFLNRVDHIVRFRQLSVDDLVEIAQMELQQLQERMDERDVRLTYERDLPEMVANEAIKRGAGARGIHRVVEEIIAVPVSDMLINPAARQRNWLHIEHDQGEIVLGWV